MALGELQLQICDLGKIYIHHASAVSDERFRHPVHGFCFRTVEADQNKPAFPRENCLIWDVTDFQTEKLYFDE